MPTRVPTVVLSEPPRRDVPRTIDVSNGFDCCCGPNPARSSSPITHRDYFIQSILNSITDRSMIGDNSIVDKTVGMEEDDGAELPRSKSNKNKRKPWIYRQWKILTISLLGILVLTIVLPVIVLSMSKKPNDGPQYYITASNSSKTEGDEEGSPLNKAWIPMEISEAFSDAASVAISADGMTLAVASATLLRILQLNTTASPETWRTTYKESVPMGNDIPIVEISGDGRTVFLAAFNTSLPVLVWRSENGWIDPTILPRSSLHLRHHARDMPPYLVSDLASNFDGRTCTVGYGHADSVQALFYENLEVHSVEIPNALTAVFEFQGGGVWNERRIPFVFPVSSFGYQVDIDDFGFVAVRAGERQYDQSLKTNSSTLFHTANRIAQNTNSWVGDFERIDLVPLAECPTAVSDIGLSSDGTRIVAVVRCSKPSGTTSIVIRTFTGPSYGENDGERTDVRTNTATTSFTTALSGNGQTLLLYLGDNRLLWMDWNEETSNWINPETLLTFLNSSPSTPDLAASRDGSVVAIADADAYGLLILKRN